LHQEWLSYGGTAETGNWAFQATISMLQPSRFERANIGAA
jgi:hypothetical protein